MKAECDALRARCEAAERERDKSKSRVVELEGDILTIHYQTSRACYAALRQVGINDEPDGGGQPDYLLPAIVSQTLHLLKERFDHTAA
jgi:hypothetical protein